MSGSSLVECLPGDRFADGYFECFVSVFKSFVHQVYHCNIEFDAEEFAEVR
jgi:hypothetical protein